MLTKVGSIAIDGLSVVYVDVEVNISNRGLPTFDIVGLPARSVDESRQRIKTAFGFSGLAFPNKKITVNLAPADLHKHGSLYDLPIAVGVICASLGIEPPPNALFFGELSLNGNLRHTRGALLLSVFAQTLIGARVFVPFACAEEAAAVTGAQVFAVDTLKTLVDHLYRGKKLIPYVRKIVPDCMQDPRLGVAFSDIVGQEQAKRALLICAAGGHNLIMSGPPGGGKTLLARALVSLLPPMLEEEALEVTKVYSLVGKIPAGSSLLRERPFRSPHHTVSYSGLIGGGVIPTPGEISLAHRGVLFMDEFSEFSRFLLEALRQPMEDGFVTIARSRGSYSFPAKFTLVAATNPCFCGYLGHASIPCKCTQKKLNAYAQRISGPILDRVDLHISVSPVNCKELMHGATSVDTMTLHKKVMSARSLQTKRFCGLGIFTNAEMENQHIKALCKLTKEAEEFLNKVSAKCSLSSRAYFKLLKVAQTIADLDSSAVISVENIAEAVQYRSNHC